MIIPAATNVPSIGGWCFYLLQKTIGQHRQLCKFFRLLQTTLEDLEEAGNEIMLLDDETVPFVVGECFAHLPREDVEERLQQRK